MANNESYFDGSLLQYVGWGIVAAVIITFTFGIATPWAVCLMESWKTKHTVINGRRLAFDGTGTQLIGNWIKWLLLTIITFGIYGLWLSINMKKWITKHTHFAS